MPSLVTSIPSRQFPVTNKNYLDRKTADWNNRKIGVLQKAIGSNLRAKLPQTASKSAPVKASPSPWYNRTETKIAVAAAGTLLLGLGAKSLFNTPVQPPAPPVNLNANDQVPDIVTTEEGQKAFCDFAATKLFEKECPAQWSNQVHVDLPVLSLGQMEKPISCDTHYPFTLTLTPAANANSTLADAAKLLAPINPHDLFTFTPAQNPPVADTQVNDESAPKVDPTPEAPAPAVTLKNPNCTDGSHECQEALSAQFKSTDDTLQALLYNV